MKKAVVFFILLFSVSRVAAQENLQFFGYVQPLFFHFQSVQPGYNEYQYSSGGISQANFFISSEFPNDLSALINFELINNYSSDRQWGSFNLQEAYLKWHPSNLLMLKFGQIIPQFNGFFEVYNRTPIIPYLMRPKLYEAASGNLVDIFDILPQKALLHSSGTLPFEDLKLDYAFYINHAVNKFHSNPQNDLLPSYVAFGQSASPYLGYGGRLGIRYGDINVGVSATSDMENRRKFKFNQNGDLADLGDIRRTRLGVNAEFKAFGFTLSGEYMIVNSHTEGRSTTVRISERDTTMLVDDFLQWAHDQDPVFIGNSFDKEWYYAALQYAPTERTFVYVMYDALNDKTDPYYFGLDGYKGINIGAGYNINDNVLFKAQVIMNNAAYENPPLTPGGPILRTDYKDYYYIFGTSISF